MAPQMGGMGSETMGLRCAGESRRPSPQRAGRGLYTGHVPKERLSDDNLLACSPRHIDEVFSMLARQPHRPIFTGGLEAALMTSQMAAQLYQLHPQRLFFAYDTPNDLEPLQEAGKMLTDAGFSKSNHALRCYILIGYKGDTMEKAHKRMGEAWRAGFMPFAMLYRDNSGQFDPAWKWFQGQWANPRITYCNCKRDFGD